MSLESNRSVYVSFAVILLRSEYSGGCDGNIFWQEAQIQGVTKYVLHDAVVCAGVV